MIPEGTGPSYPNTSEGVRYPSLLFTEVVNPKPSSRTSGYETQLRSFMCSLLILKEKVNQVQSYVNMFVPQGNYATPNDGSTSSMAIATMGNVIQEIIGTASSMMFNCQQMALDSPNGGNLNNHHHMASSSHMQGAEHNSQTIFDGEGLFNWYTESVNSMTTTTTTTASRVAVSTAIDMKEMSKTRIEAEEYDIVEIDATDLLAKYTHYCQVCAKGFKRDANLRMHMRAHGDEYKSTQALSNPLKKVNEENSPSIKVPRKYSCPHEGCRWNKKHIKFQPLKSIICVKNHYKRSHCPKMYVCKRCNRKQFSVLSDLRTHEKHCGDLKWQCSCGTTFSRKDKLMGHVALFIGHSPIVNPLGTLDHKLENQHGVQIMFKDS